MLTVQNKEGVTLAFLNNLLEAKIHEVINGEYILTFTATVDTLKTPVLYDENNIIVCDNDYFRVRVIEEIHSEDGQDNGNDIDPCSVFPEDDHHA